MRLSAASVKAWRSICQSLVLLPGLTSISIEDTDLHAVALHDWALGRRLASLSLSNCSMTRVPPAACNLPNLRSLFLSGLPLTGLDSGSYLTNLHCMMIQCDGHTSGSEVLCKAEHLQRVIVICESHDASKQVCFCRAQLQGFVPSSCTLVIFGKEAGFGLVRC